MVFRQFKKNNIRLINGWPALRIKTCTDYCGWGLSAAFFKSKPSPSLLPPGQILETPAI